jgi:hypothetical protein
LPPPGNVIVPELSVTTTVHDGLNTQLIAGARCDCQKVVSNSLN